MGNNRKISDIFNIHVYILAKKALK
jgi:hypothetical protein